MDFILLVYKGYKLRVLVDMDGGMWLQKINATSDIFVNGLNYTPDINHSISKYGGINGFVSQVVYPKTNEFMAAFFPKEDVGSIPEEGLERLEWIMKNLFKFNASTERFDYTPPED